MYQQNRAELSEHDRWPALAALAVACWIRISVLPPILNTLNHFQFQFQFFPMQSRAGAGCTTGRLNPESAAVGGARSGSTPHVRRAVSARRAARWSSTGSRGRCPSGLARPAAPPSGLMELSALLNISLPPAAAAVALSSSAEYSTLNRMCLAPDSQSLTDHEPGSESWNSKRRRIEQREF